MHVASGGKIKRRFSGVGYTCSGLLGNFLMRFLFFLFFFFSLRRWVRFRNLRIFFHLVNNLCKRANSLSAVLTNLFGLHDFRNTICNKFKIEYL